MGALLKNKQSHQQSKHCQRRKKISVSRNSEYVQEGGYILGKETKGSMFKHPAFIWEKDGGNHLVINLKELVK